MIESAPARRNSHDVNVLSLSRVFLFGSRDLWFEVPLPFFLRDTASGIGWSRAATGAFLAAFIIVYGQVQSWTPQLVLRPLRQTPDKYVAAWWCAALVVPTAILGEAPQGGRLLGGRGGPAWLAEVAQAAPLPTWVLPWRRRQGHHAVGDAARAARGTAALTTPATPATSRGPAFPHQTRACLPPPQVASC
jgi:hypothetical protein